METVGDILGDKMLKDDKVGDRDIYPIYRKHISGTCVIYLEFTAHTKAKIIKMDGTHGTWHVGYEMKNPPPPASKVWAYWSGPAETHKFKVGDYK